MKTILATTYAVKPGRGSEDGMGWNYVLQIARFNKVIAITRENNRDDIELFMDKNPSELYKNIQFRYFDLPYWMRFWKKKGRGAMLYYWMWQRAIPGFVKRQGFQFDIAHNLNFHNDWTPSYLWKLKKPFVWGPIGHHPPIPIQYLKHYNLKYYIKDRMGALIKKYFWTLSPSLKKTIRNADYIWAMNSSVKQVLNLKSKNCSISASVASEDFGLGTKRNEKFRIVTAGRLVPLKGFDLSIKAYAEFLTMLPENRRKKCELVVVGSGPESEFYKQITKEKGVSEFVRFIDWIERNDLMKLMGEASLFLFPSHEGAGMVVPEALSFGLPVVCLENAGPGEFINSHCGMAIPVKGYDETVLDLAQRIKTLFDSPYLLENMQRNARQHFLTHFHWDRRGEKLKSIYENLIV
jgi:glycosyltransferase involved in cell wall biosynthesis